MRSFSNRQIEKSLRKSINNLTSKRMTSNMSINYKEEYKMKKSKLFLPLLVPAIAVFVAVFGIGTNYYNKNLKVNSNITLDVNPSIVLSTNYYNKVIKVKALNDDGEEILKDINVNNLTPDKATNIIIDELIKEGYLEGDGSNILLTVQNNDLEKAKEIEATLLKSVNSKLDEEYIAGTVITQTDTIRKNIDEDLKDLMDTYNISYSKAVFISNVTKKDETLKVEDLAVLKISEISKLINDNKINISDIVGHNNEDSMYESAALIKAKKGVQEAEKAKTQAEVKAQAAEEEVQAKIKNNQNAEAAQKAYEEAEQARIRAEQEALEAQNAYKEAEAEANKGDETQNTETNQNSNGQTNGVSTENQGSTSGSGTSSADGNTGIISSGSGNTSTGNSNRN